MKKILYTIGLLALLLPSVSYADFAAGFSATTSTSTTIYPTYINGSPRNILANSFVATSTATSTLPNLFTNVLSLGATAISYIQSLFSGTTPIVVSNTGVVSCPTCALNTSGYTNTFNIAGTGISVSSATGSSTISNTGVLSNIAGTNITVSGATGNVTISAPNAVTFTYGSSTYIGQGTTSVNSITTLPNLTLPLSQTTGILPFANGGTGTSSCPANDVFLSNGTIANCVATSSLGITSMNYFTNSSATTSLTTGSILTAGTGTFGTVNATSTTGTSTFSGSVGIGTTTPASIFDVEGGGNPTVSTLHSGSMFSFVFEGIGRTTNEFVMGVAAATGQFFSGTAPFSAVSGDGVFKGQTGGLNRILLGVGSGAATMVVDQPSVGVAINGPTALSGNLTVSATSTLTGLQLTNLTNSILAVDNNGNVIATTTSAGGVTAVNASGGLQSSGGSTPTISPASGFTIPLTASTTQWGNLVNASATLPYYIAVGTTSVNSITTLPNLSLPVSQLTGVLPVANGGTGSSSYAIGSILTGSSTNPVFATLIGASSTCLLSNGTIPVWGTCASGGGGTNFFSNAAATTSLTTGSILTALTGTFGTINATSTTGTSTITNSLLLGASSTAPAITIQPNATTGQGLYLSSAFYDSTNASGTLGQILKSTGTSTLWTSTSTLGLGTVTSVSGSGGSTGLTLSGGAITTSGTLTIGGTLVVSNGGTGSSSYAVGALLVGSSTNPINQLLIGASSTCLLSNGTVPIWGSTCGSGGGTNYFSNSSATTTLTTGSILQSATLDATSSVVVGTTTVPVFTVSQAGFLGLGSSTPGSVLTVVGTTSNPMTNLATFASSTGSTTFAIDSKGHIVTGGLQPTVSGGTSSMISPSNDNSGSIAVAGTALTSVTLTFATPWNKTPVCTESDNVLATAGDITSISTTTLVIGFGTGGVTTATVWYQCSQPQ